MKKPQPKAEIVTRVTGDMVIITTHSRDAREWIEESAVDFGLLLPHTTRKVSQRYTLVVDDGYNVNEIQAYLESQDET